MSEQAALGRVGGLEERIASLEASLVEKATRVAALQAQMEAQVGPAADCLVPLASQSGKCVGDGGRHCADSGVVGSAVVVVRQRTCAGRTGYCGGGVRKW